MTTFGAPIPHDGGEMPAWLDGMTKIKRNTGQTHWTTFASLANWPTVASFRLPADHFAYLALERDFVPWGGGDGPPGDWDGGDVLFRDGEPGEIGTGNAWVHYGSGDDIIGYRRRAEPVEADNVLSFQRCQRCGTCSPKSFGVGCKLPECEYRAEHEARRPTPQPPVVSEVTVAFCMAALTEARAALHQHYVDWDGEPEDAIPLQEARAQCDAALAHLRPLTPETPDNRAAGEEG